MTSPCILVVDDSSMIRAMVKKYLAPFQGRLDVHFAVDGFEALRLVAQLKPVLVFADVLMPRLSGLQLCALVKKNPETSGTAVYMLTSKEGEVDKASGRNAGASGYIVKPFSQETLRELLAQALPQLEAAEA